MRGTLFWVASTVLAFAATAGVFLMLAEIGTAPPDRSLSVGDGGGAETSAPLSLELPRSSLEGLEEAEGQDLGMTLSNGSGREITGITVYLIVSSEDTSEQRPRYYESAETRLGSQESKVVDFTLDLSPPETGDGSETGTPDEESFNVLEVRAASSEGFSAVKTAVLSF